MLSEKKTINDLAGLTEIINRVSMLKEDDEPCWGKMTAAQMLRHCALILHVSTGKTALPKAFFAMQAFGIMAKHLLSVLNCEIPKNMPTFKVLVIEDFCNFEYSRNLLLKSLEEYMQACPRGLLVSTHPLFGSMTARWWGFLHYKHLDHHLKQFNA